MPDREKFALKSTAERMANAACNADQGLVSSVTVAAYLDGTAVEVKSFHWDTILKSRKTLLSVVNAYAVSIRKDEPVVVRLLPVRFGTTLPRVVAVVRPGSQPKFLTCDVAACAEGAPSAASPPPRKPAP